MPAPIFERVADKLGLSPDHSEKLVRAMIREIRKRAAKGQGVRVPDLGSFVVENGQLTFEPEASLARSVNHRFEGLSEESVALPEVEPSSQSGEGPTTITRGFDMGAWDPLDTGGASSNSGKSQSSSGGVNFDDGPDTDEFQAPPDTDEFEAPDTGEFRAAAEEDTEDQEQQRATETEASEENGGRSTWDVGSVRPVRDATDDTTADDSKSDEKTLSPARLRGEEGSADVEEPQIDASADLEVSDHRQANPPSDDPYFDSGFRTDTNVSDDDGFSRDEMDRSTSQERNSTSSDYDKSDDDEPNIWSSESVWDLSTVTSQDVEDDDDFDFDEDNGPADSTSMEDSENSDASDTEPEYVSYRPPDADEQSAEDRPARSIFDFNEESAKEKKEAPKTTKLDASDIQGLDKEREKQADGKNDSRSRGAATTVTVIVLLILVMMGGWIVLGQQGIVPSPSRTLGLSDGLTETANPSVTPEGGNTSTATNGTSDPSTSERAATPNANASEDNASSSTSATERDASVTSDDEVSSESRGFDASAGGFTIAVASRESESEARALVEQFRRNLSDTSLRIDLVVGESGGTTRFRVGVGQFPTRSEATQMRNQMQSRLPNGAWPVPID